MNSLFAQSNDRDIRRAIQTKAQAISRAVPTADLSLTQLREIDRTMTDLLSRLNNPGPDPVLYERCVQFAYEEYRRVMNNSDALVRGQQNCRNIQDLVIAEFSYEELNRVLSREEAMDIALQGASQLTVVGKIEMLVFSFEKHVRVLPRDEAIQNALRNISSVPLQTGLQCFQRNFPVHNRSYNSSEAMSMTAQGCAARS